MKFVAKTPCMEAKQPRFLKDLLLFNFPTLIVGPACGLRALLFTSLEVLLVLPRATARVDTAK